MRLGHLAVVDLGIDATHHGGDRRVDHPLLRKRRKVQPFQTNAIVIRAAHMRNAYMAQLVPETLHANHIHLTIGGKMKHIFQIGSRCIGRRKHLLFRALDPHGLDFFKQGPSTLGGIVRHELQSLSPRT